MHQSLDLVQLDLIISIPSPQEHELLSYSSTRTKAPSVIISGLKPATWYIFSVRTRTPAGYSSYSPKYEYRTTGDCKFLSNFPYCFFSRNVYIWTKWQHNQFCSAQGSRQWQTPVVISIYIHQKMIKIPDLEGRRQINTKKWGIAFSGLSCSFRFPSLRVNRTPTTPHQITLHAGCTKPCTLLIYFLFLIISTHQRLFGFISTQSENNSLSVQIFQS